MKEILVRSRIIQRLLNKVDNETLLRETTIDCDKQEAAAVKLVDEEKARMKGEDSGV